MKLLALIPMIFSALLVGDHTHSAVAGGLTLLALFLFAFVVFPALSARRAAPGEA